MKEIKSPLQAVRIYFGLQALSQKELSFATSYRITRNLDALKGIGEKYEKDLRTELESHPEKTHAAWVECDLAVSKKWAELPEDEAISLREIDLSGEGESFSASLLSPILPILTEPKENS